MKFSCVDYSIKKGGQLHRSVDRIIDQLGDLMKGKSSHASNIGKSSVQAELTLTRSSKFELPSIPFLESEMI